jgi:hypothetical protein
LKKLKFSNSQKRTLLGQFSMNELHRPLCRGCSGVDNSGNIRD